jgi:hypothetical protein
MVYDFNVFARAGKDRGETRNSPLESFGGSE